MSGSHIDVTAPLRGESDVDRHDRVIRHLQQEHPEADLMDETWLEHPLRTHEELHRLMPQDLPDPRTETAPMDVLPPAVTPFPDLLRERLSEMLGASLLPVVIDALALQISLTTRVWLLEQADAAPNSVSRRELRLVAERAIEGLDHLVGRE